MLFFIIHLLKSCIYTQTNTVFSLRAQVPEEEENHSSWKNNSVSDSPLDMNAFLA